MAKKKSAAERRAQSKRAADRVAAAEPASAMSAAEAEAQAQLLAQFRPLQPAIAQPVSPPSPSKDLLQAAVSRAAHGPTAAPHDHPDLVLIRQLAERRRQQALAPPAPPLLPRSHDVPRPRWSPPPPAPRRGVSFSANTHSRAFHADDPPAALRPSASPAASAPPSRPPSAATSFAPCPAQPPPPQPSSRVPQPCSPSPRPPPRDLLSLVAGATRQPWCGLRQRRHRLQQRAPHPHRHQRQSQRDARLHAEHVFLVHDAAQQALERELRQALFAALGHMYPSTGSSPAAGSLTPEPPVRPDSPQLEVEVSLCVFQGEKRAGYHDPRAVASRDDVNRICSGFRGWRPHELAGLKATHSFIVRDRDKWHRGIDEFAVNYLIGLHDRFCRANLRDRQS